jgi:hypothetical protein
MFLANWSIAHLAQHVAVPQQAQQHPQPVIVIETHAYVCTRPVAMHLSSALSSSVSPVISLKVSYVNGLQLPQQPQQQPQHNGQHMASTVRQAHRRRVLLHVTFISAIVRIGTRILGVDECCCC